MDDMPKLSFPRQESMAKAQGSGLPTARLERRLGPRPEASVERITQTLSFVFEI